jgi:hypothetical protein
MRVLILSDSLGLPREINNELVSFEDTYVYLLRKKYPKADIVHLGIGGATMADIYKQSLYYPVMNPDYVFIQCGIVDCAPRAFTRFESKVIRELRLKKLFNLLVKFLRRYRKHTYTTKRKFKKYIHLTNNNFKVKTDRIFYIGILPGSEDYEKLLPNIKKQIKAYNNILKLEGVNYIGNEDFPREGILLDHHHLNVKGNEIIFNKIDNILSSELSQ